MLKIKQTKAELLEQLFYNWCGEKPKSIYKLPASGSKREYYRITGNNHKAVGAINNDREENLAFIEFSRHFKKYNLPVPGIYYTDLDHDAYLQEDLGDITLFDYLVEKRQHEGFSEELVKTYKRVLEMLPQFQVKAAKDLNYDVCYPRASFDRQSMKWDLSYFKYYFLKLADIPFNEQLLEDDFNRLIDFLLQEDTDNFLYRDFQSRNIMLCKDNIYFIDYQGGRRGALQYDVASLLYDSKADIPQHLREEFLEHYISHIQHYKDIDPDKFRKNYYAYVLIRMMQAMGAYGFRGFYEKKTHFLQSIPYALKNLEWILRNVELPVELHSLGQVFENLLTSKKLKKYTPKKTASSPLTVSINSFSYKKGIPEDNSGHGGGFVFDCRAIPNPGKFEKYKNVNGKDKIVIDFFAKESSMHEFLTNVYAIVDMSIDTYEERNFSHLMVSFGCTGGQHRSVYCAEQLATHLRQKYSVRLALWHREQE